MPIDPTVLPSYVKVTEGKQRDLPSVHNTQTNFDQEVRKEKIRDNQNPIYDISLYVPKGYQQGFNIWKQRNGFTTEFTMPLRVEGGIQTQTVNWVDEPLNATENRAYFVYPCSVQGRGLDDGISDATEEEQDLFYEFMPYNNLWSKIINEDIPQI